MSMDKVDLIQKLNGLSATVLASLLVEVSMQYEDDIEVEIAKSKKANKRSHKILKDARRQIKETKKKGKSESKHGESRQIVANSPKVGAEEIEVDYQTLQTVLTPDDGTDGWCAGEMIRIVRRQYDDKIEDASKDKYRR